MTQADYNPLSGTFVRKKRNEMGYERAWIASEGEAEEMVELAKKLKERVQNWLYDEHPELIDTE